jgi:hypothetical protein
MDKHPAAFSTLIYNTNAAQRVGYIRPSEMDDLIASSYLARNPSKMRSKKGQNDGQLRLDENEEVKGKYYV